MEWLGVAFIVGIFLGFALGAGQTKTSINRAYKDGRLDERYGFNCPSRHRRI